MVEILRQRHRVEGAAGRGRSGEAKDGENYVRSAKSGHVSRILGSLSDPPNFSSLLLSPFVVVVVVRAGRTEAEQSAVELSEAKTQRQPHSAERIARHGGGVFVCYFVIVSVSFFRQGKRHTNANEVYAELSMKSWCIAYGF